MIYDCKNKEIVRALEEKANRTGWVGGTECLGVDINVTRRSENEIDTMCDSIPESDEWWWDLGFYPMNDGSRIRYLTVIYIEQG